MPVRAAYILTHNAAQFPTYVTGLASIRSRSYLAPEESRYPLATFQRVSPTDLLVDDRKLIDAANNLMTHVRLNEWPIN